MKIKALSVVSPFGQWIVEGTKTIEVRSWIPQFSPHEDLLIVENKKYLLKEGETDPDGRAVAIVRIREIREFLETDMQASRATRFDSGYYTWALWKVRPLKNLQKVMAARKIYELDFQEEMLG